jgi:hypothetical protein
VRARIAKRAKAESQTDVFMARFLLENPVTALANEEIRHVREDRTKKAGFFIGFHRI